MTRNKFDGWRPGDGYFPLEDIKVVVTEHQVPKAKCTCEMKVRPIGGYYSVPGCMVCEPWRFGYEHKDCTNCDGKGRVLAKKEE